MANINFLNATEWIPDDGALILWIIFTGDYQLEHARTVSDKDVTMPANSLCSHGITIELK